MPVCLLQFSMSILSVFTDVAAYRDKFNLSDNTYFVKYSFALSQQAYIMLNKFIPVIFVFFIQVSLAQSVLPPSPEMQNAYRKGSRDKNGAPGKSYWQNITDYTIKVSFDPETRELKGTVAIAYTNNSPDTLNRLLFKLFPNLYQKEAMRTMPVLPADLGDGVHISRLAIDGQIPEKTNLITRGTNLTVRKVQVLPGQHIQVTVDYNYQLNKGSFIRTGQVDTGAFFIAYFFPRLAVYDDIDGWNEYPYTGHDEFYNDYGRFNVEITLPGNYLAWATGNLLNPDEVYTPKIVKRLHDAEQSDGITDVITAADQKDGNITIPQKINTWKFGADNVTDFAFGISNHYVWKASSLMVEPKTGRRSRVDAVYNPEHEAYVPVINYARNTVKAMSYNFPGLPFPYAHETVFDGLDAMEYPMMVNNLPFKTREETVELTTHEVFHTLFPFFVGTNETKHAFMDEGWATLTEFLLHPLVVPGVPLDYDISDVNKSAGTEQDVPIMTLTPQLYGKARFADKDLKPALGYLYVKEMLGDTLFLKALKQYILTWQGKHPTPYDFFYSINTACGVNLNWFWNNWFFNKGIPDLAIGAVSHTGKNYTINIKNLGTEVVPVHLTVWYVDGSSEVISKSIACWASGLKTLRLKLVTQKQIKQLVLGTAFDADVDKSNNVWRP